MPILAVTGESFDSPPQAPNRASATRPSTRLRAPRAGSLDRRRRPEIRHVRGVSGLPGKEGMTKKFERPKDYEHLATYYADLCDQFLESYIVLGYYSISMGARHFVMSHCLELALKASLA